jgi:uncharacterized protein DUF6271
MPADRPCTEAIHNAVSECSLLRQHTAHDYIFLLAEHNGVASDEHADAIERASRRFAVGCVHLTPGRWDAILSKMLSPGSFSVSAQERIRSLLAPRDVAYSAGPNKAFLVAAALGIGTLHRRDTDQVPDDRSGSTLFPGVLEAAAIGRPAGEVTPLAGTSAPAPSLLGRPVSFVGSSVFGDSGHDRRDLLTLGEEYVVRLERLARPAVPAGQLRSLVHDKFVTQPATRYDSDFYEVCDSTRTAIGVSCVRGIFRELPEMPILQTLGSDYFQKTLLYQLGRPVLFHSRKMRHCYDRERAANSDTGRAVAYALRDLRNLILLRVRSALNAAVREHPQAYLLPGGSLDAERYADGLLAASREELPAAEGIPREYAEVYACAAGFARGALAARLHAVAEASRRGDFVADVGRGVADYSWLIRRWRALVRAAPRAAATLQGYIRP